MPRRPPIDTSIPVEEIELPMSRTKKRELRKDTQAQLDALTKLLAEMPPKALAKVGLPQELNEAIRMLATMAKGGALARQRRLVAGKLRAHDVQELRKRAEIALGIAASERGRLQRLERERDVLLTGGDDALRELFARYPAADRQRLRQAVRAAIAERMAAATDARKSRELFQLLKECDDEARAVAKLAESQSSDESDDDTE